MIQKQEHFINEYEDNENVSRAYDLTSSFRVVVVVVSCCCLLLLLLFIFFIVDIIILYSLLH